jgi:hypothetical protein
MKDLDIIINNEHKKLEFRQFDVHSYRVTCFKGEKSELQFTVVLRPVQNEELPAFCPVNPAKLPTWFKCHGVMKKINQHLKKVVQ